MEDHKPPSIKNLTSDNFGRPPKEENPVLQALGKPHIESFDYMLTEGLSLAIKHLDAVEFELINKERISIKWQSCVLHPPQVHNSLIPIKASTIYPTECRQRAETYKGLLIGSLGWSVDGVQQKAMSVNLGEIPIMVKSKACHLNGLSPSQLVERGEDEDLWGGFFIIKGHERLLRMLVQTRSNYPLALQRGSWKNRGAKFSDIGVIIRCVGPDLSCTNNVLHYVLDGTAKLMFSYQKHLYFAPLILVLKALVDVTDEFIFQQLLLGAEDDLYYKGCVANMLRELHDSGVHNHNDAKAMIGSTFKVKLTHSAPWGSDNDACSYVLKKCVLIHLNSNLDKFQLLCFMSRKLFSTAQDHSKTENMDSTIMHEVVLGGVVYQQYLAERLLRWVQMLKLSIVKRSNSMSASSYRFNSAEMANVLRRQGLIDGMITNFLATGNIFSVTGLGLMQNKGLTIVAENINRMRYMSHFRAIHRGSYFQEMRTTSARQLLPDAWGFICPVHTPDGMPCGLLNHLGRHCEVVTSPTDISQVPSVLGSLGMEPIGARSLGGVPKYWVVLDGRVLGVVSQDKTQRLVDQMRYLKTQGDRIPNTLEIVLVPHEAGLKGLYPALFLFSNMSRLVRPVFNLAAQRIEMVGTFEQVYLNIAIVPSEIVPGVTTHMEISETTFLSNLACLIPMPDCNQSPRNMYQCQMGKQSMGTPVHTWHLQSETKLYRLQTPAAPLFRPAQYDAVELDNHCMGVNAIVAVISYTGYDMEDAMIINKSSYERGLAHGSIYKSDFVELEEKNFFARDPEKLELAQHLDRDGLPYVGSRLKENDPYYCIFDHELSRYQVKKYHGTETVYIESVKMCGEPVTTSKSKPLKACISMRVPRNPTVGDKFASRAGQKGICSQKWPAEDLPFTESGLVPDIVFNPHGFPSRMTIAMMVELMAGKAAAVHGLVHDASPFRFSEEDTAIDYFSKLLQEGGYNYLGTERMYSGVDGREMKADIFFGIVYYQRLRHMVSDKWQVRSTGAVDSVTHQPVKGRRKGGGVRFGEMERDSLISHGASFLLQDRLLHCSDKSSALVCRECGSMLSTICAAPTTDNTPSKRMCKVCGPKGNVELVELPHILRYLVAQLASVNISLKLNLTESQITT